MPEQHYTVRDIRPYINWTYFYHAWGFRPTATGCEEAVRLRREAEALLDERSGEVAAHCLYRLCHANSEGDDLWIEGTRFPLLRQQRTHQEGAPYLCLSDFVRPISSGIPDTVGLFAATAALSPTDTPGDPYAHLLSQTLNDRLAEAATERMHLYVRKEAWGYAPDEDLPISGLLAEHFQGIRPAVGYPSLPDQSVNFLIDRLLCLRRIGITLTENGAMHPHSSVSGLMLAHPAARYFAIGTIGPDQLKDYACRRGYPVEKMQKFLASLLA